jgi:hypothetical protein
MFKKNHFIEWIRLRLQVEKGGSEDILIGFLEKAGTFPFFLVTHWLRVSDR